MEKSAVKIPKAPPVRLSDSSRHIGQVFTQIDLADALPSRTSIGARGALMSSDFVACETVKCRAIRQLPIKVVRRTERGREPVEDSDLSRVLHRPNALMSMGDLMSWAILRRDVHGTAYIRVYRDSRGRIVNLRPVEAAVDVSYDRDLGIVVYQSQGDDLNPPFTCREDGIIVLKTDISEDAGVHGASIAEKAAEDIGLSVDINRFYRSILENGNHFKGWLETDQKLTKADVDAVAYSLQRTAGAEHAGETRIFDRGLKYHDVSVALDGLDIVEQERFVLEKVCRACHVDLHHVYADSGSSTATASTGYDIDFVKHTVLPEVTAIEQAFQPVLDGAASLGGSDSGMRLKIDVNGLLRGDFATRMEGYRIGVYAGIYSRAWVCEQEDIPSLPGQEQLMMPTAYYLVDDEGKPYIPVADPGTSGQSDGVSGREERAMSDRLAPILADTEERIAKRAAADGDTPKTRAFAKKVLAPVALVMADAGELIETDGIIEDAIAKGVANAQG